MSSPGPGRLDPRTPVLVGVGEASSSVEPVALMTEALVAAADDAGSRALLGAIDRISVPQGTWKYGDPGRGVAAGVGAAGARTVLAELGVPQQLLFNDAVDAITSGRSDVVAVVGGEARRWARTVETESGDPQPDAVPGEVLAREGPPVEPIEVATRLWQPVLQYAMIANALRRAEGRTIDEDVARTAGLWERCNVVARANPRAAFAAPRSADDIAAPSPRNRPLAFPYNKWHASQWTVDQAAALILCPVEAARRFGIGPDRWVFPHAGLVSSHAVSLLRRRDIHRWPAMAVLGRALTAGAGLSVDDAEVVELYSCFPSAVRVQQRELAVDAARVPTLTGGMAFAGGPFNNYVLQSTVEVARRLRDAEGSTGVITTVSGLLTKPGIGLWGSAPGRGPALIADLATEVRAATEVVEVAEDPGDHTGGVTVATYTVTYEGMDPVGLIVVGDTEDGRRCVGFSTDAELASHATRTELVGTRGRVESGTFHTG